MNLGMNKTVGSNVIIQYMFKRLCSSRSHHANNTLNKSNTKLFPSFSISDSENPWKNITNKHPNHQIFWNILLGRDIYYDKNHQLEHPFDFHELHKNCLFAIDVVSNTLSKEKDLRNSNLPDILTNECFNQIVELFEKDSKFQKSENRIHLYVPEEDIFFSWIEKTSSDRMRIVTMSYPCYQYIIDQMKLNVDRKLQILDEMVKQRLHQNKSTGKVIDMNSDLRSRRAVQETLDMNEFQQNIQNTRNDLRIFDPSKHMKGNQVVCSNWDFVKVDNEWILDGINMKTLTNFFEHIFPGSWKVCMIRSMMKQEPFVMSLRFNYILICLEIVLIVMVQIFLTQYFMQAEKSWRKDSTNTIKMFPV